MRPCGSCAHVTFLDEGAFEAWSEPTARGSRRLAGVDLNKARTRHALNAVVELSTRPNGFTLDHLATVVRERSGGTLDDYSTRNAAYELTKFRGKNLSIQSSTRVATAPIPPPGFVPCAPSSCCATK